MSDWICVECGSKTFARVDGPDGKGGFTQSDKVRCVGCKAVSALPMTSETIPKSRLDTPTAWIFTDPTGCEHTGTDPAWAERFARQNPDFPVRCLYSASTIKALSAQVAEHDAHVARLIEQGQQAEYERGKAVDALAVVTAERDALIRDNASYVDAAAHEASRADRMERNRDLWKEQCDLQAVALMQMREALKNLIQQLDVVHVDKHYRAVWELSHMQRGPYTGPTYVVELGAAREAILSPEVKP